MKSKKSFKKSYLENVTTELTLKLPIVVSVVLVSFNTRNLTLEAIESLQNSVSNGDLKLQIIVVDNGSTDGSAEAIATRFPDATTIKLGKNLGFGAANNRAFELVDGSYILLLNTDTIVRDGAVESMVTAIEENMDIGAVGCRLENSDGSLQKSCWSFPTPARACLEAIGLNRSVLRRDWHRWDHSSTQMVDFVIGAALLLRRQALESIGGFDERFFLYAEEADLQKRLWQAGWNVVFCPNGTIVHFGGASGEPLGDRQFIEFNRACALYIRKHHGWLGLSLFAGAQVVGALPRLLLGWLLSGVDNKFKKLRVVNQKKLRWWLGFDRRPGIRELGESARQSI